MQQTILVVDDEPANLRMVERLLRKDYRVLTAGSGAEAIEALRHENVDLIITDQRMPGMTGTELLRQTIDVRPEPARIILTGYSDSDALIDAINTAAVRKFVSKPWDPSQLKETVDCALQDHHKEREQKKLIEDLVAFVKAHPCLFVPDTVVGITDERVTTTPE